ncbi:hypothetical protein [Qipengyuania sp.]|uniref:hypothetical protein n=1 Tax=Qipengyuania sp. TaxID=2004515 RepID=UPI0035C7CEB7
MTDDKGFDGWNAIATDAAFDDPQRCAARATRFERTIRRRNLIEFAAAGLIIPLFATGAIAAGYIGMWGMVAGCTMIIAGTLAIIGWLFKDGLNLRREPEVSCRDHLRAQYVRQRDLLRAVPKRYLAPLLPGMAAIYATVIVGVAQTRGWTVAIQGVWAPMAGTVAFFAFVAWLNLRAARGLEGQIASLDAA